MAKHKKAKKTSSLKQNAGTSQSISKSWIIAPALATALVAMLVYVFEGWLFGHAVNTPLNLLKAVDGEWRNGSTYDERLWGTYRSNVYFGVRPRIPRSVIAGMMWFKYDKELNVRHTCEHGDKLQKFGWIRHDGISFGQQEILDSGLILKTDFISRSDSAHGESWTARFSGHSSSAKSSLVSLVLYVHNEGRGEMAYHLSGNNSIQEIYGHTPHPRIKEFRVFFPHAKVSNDAVFNYLSTRRKSVHDLAAFVRSVVKGGTPRKQWSMIAQLPGEVYGEGEERKPNLIAYQVTTTLPFEIDMVFEAGMYSSVLSSSGEKFTHSLEHKAKQFDERFEKTFGLNAKGFSESEVKFAKAVMSNLIGGISYFYGQSRVISKGLSEPVDYWPSALYTAVPSRSFFPRGFLWDEGFHQLVVSHWDSSIVKDVISHWLDLMNTEGWIPREQILGLEALSKVPEEFVVQHNENANPPTFFLTLETLLQVMEKNERMDIAFLHSIYPRLQVWFDWFNTTQVGLLESTYRWRGRNGTTDRELNPKTLTSGLDDYPRASHPSEDEYHVDLRCWMALASGVMEKIAVLLGENGSPYQLTHQQLTDQRLLDKFHWDDKGKAYADYGLHTSAVKLVRVTPEPNKPSYKKRKVTKQPIQRFVNNFGYVNLFPFFMRMISPNSHKLGYNLERLKNESYLWTPYGLRSLSRVNSLYNRYNTEHDPPYWRGAIWINMNYLALKALHYYSNTEGPFKSQSRRLYEELRLNIIHNMHEQYVKSGYVWEQYDDQIGVGKGTHPFTGWSSLIILIMAEKY